jgi:hypothetical protein
MYFELFSSEEKRKIAEVLRPPPPLLGVATSTYYH